jgi:hypothetical protein
MTSPRATPHETRAAHMSARRPLLLALPALLLLTGSEPCGGTPAPN